MTGTWRAISRATPTGTRRPVPPGTVASAVSSISFQRLGLAR